MDLLEPFYMLRSVPMAPSFDGTLSPKTARYAVSPRIVLALSRPLFWRPVGAFSGSLMEVIEFAKKKLSFSQYPDRIIDSLSTKDGFVAALALFASRIQFGVLTMQPLSTEIVWSRMAYCRSVSSDGSQLQVGNISEPAIAEAACWFLAQASVLCKILEHVVSCTKLANTYSQGAVGEVVAMTVLCMAWNMVCDVQRIAHPDEDSSPLYCFPLAKM
jgi:hypothetical protein